MINRTDGETKIVASIGTQVTTTDGDLCSTFGRSKSVKKSLLEIISYFLIVLIVLVSINSYNLSTMTVFYMSVVNGFLWIDVPFYPRKYQTKNKHLGQVVRKVDIVIHRIVNF